jgi:hypothetical protein
LRGQWNLRGSRQKLCLLNECPGDVHTSLSPIRTPVSEHRSAGSEL